MEVNVLAPSYFWHPSQIQCEGTVTSVPMARSPLFLPMDLVGTMQYLLDEEKACEFVLGRPPSNFGLSLSCHPTQVTLGKQVLTRGSSSPLPHG